MSHFRHRHLLIAFLMLGVILSVIAALWLAGAKNLKARSSEITLGMPRIQVEQLLGRPALVLNRTGGRGTALSWVDSFWQVDVLTDPQGRTESVGCIPSDSFYRRTLGRLLGRGHTHPHQPAP